MEVLKMPEQCAALIDELIELRKAKGWSQKDLSAVCGLTQSVIARIESKKSVPTIATLYKIVSALGASLTVVK
jgi:transcriptional regulator with XRE-family HTH domain